VIITDNILYLDDYINFYNKKNNTLLIIKPYKNTLKNGIIIDREKFIMKMTKVLEKNRLNKNLFSEGVSVISNNLFNKESKLLIKQTMEELNYVKIDFIQETNFLKVNKDNIFINCNYEYFYILFNNSSGNVICNIYKNDAINKALIKSIIKLINKRNVILYGKNYKEIKNILEKNHIEYFRFEETDNLIIKFLLNSKKV